MDAEKNPLQTRTGYVTPEQHTNKIKHASGDILTMYVYSVPRLLAGTLKKASASGRKSYHTKPNKIPIGQYIVGKFRLSPKTVTKDKNKIATC